MKINRLNSFDEEYPVNLLNAQIAVELDVMGEFKPQDKMALAIVGTRQMSKMGAKLARDYSFYLAANGITVVSGLARGIDSVAHKAALAAGGRTIAVLGGGFSHFYPKENKQLAEKVAQSGAVISPFEKDEKPLAKNFLARNKIIAGLSLAVLVIEGRRRSGTLSTAAAAINMNKEVFVTTGTPSPNDEAGKYLLQNGAREISSPIELLDYVNMSYGKR